MRNSQHLSALLVAGVLVLSGCVGFSDSGRPDPISPVASPAPKGYESFYKQSVQFESCGEQLFCADIKVPLNWDDGQSQPITIATVYRAADKKNSSGFILLNPGGPGASGYDWVKESGSSLATKKLRENFNLLGFDPRGVGKSSAVKCLTDSEYDDFLYGVTGFDLGSDKDLAVARSAVKNFSQKCLENTGELLGQVDTVSAAKDMDLIRAVLGQQKLNFLGYSYGSFLGTTYAALFPERVGRFVLDGAIDPTVSDEQQTLIQLEAFENALRAFLESCNEFPDCPFTGVVQEDLRKIQRLLLALEKNPLPAQAGRELTIWAAITGLIMPLYSDSYWPYLATAFDQALNESRGDLFLVMADQYNDRDEKGSYRTNLIAANYAINCLDSRSSTDVVSIEKQNKALVAAAPTLGRYWQFGSLRCENWPFDVKQVPDSYSAKGAPTILVIGTTGDPATPYSQAQALSGRILHDAFLLTYNGEGHTIYGRQVACVDNTVDKFFLTGELPSRDPNC